MEPDYLPKCAEAAWRFHTSISYTIIGSDNGLKTVRQQTIIRANAVVLLIGTTQIYREFE